MTVTESSDKLKLLSVALLHTFRNSNIYKTVIKGRNRMREWAEQMCRERKQKQGPCVHITLTHM